nr:hypothetical protein [Rhodoferax antarcticus]
MRHHLAQRHTRAQAHRITGDAATATTATCPAFGEFGDGLRGLVLHELAHVVADHTHADFLVEYFLQVFRQRDVLYRHAFELEADFLELGRQLPGQGLRKAQLVGRQVQKGNAAARHRVTDVLQHQATQLSVDVLHVITLARARDFGVKQLGVGHTVVVVAKSAQAHRAKVGVANGDGLRRAPFLIQLLARAEKVHVTFER